MKRYLHAAIVAAAVGAVSSLVLVPNGPLMAQDAPAAAATAGGERHTVGLLTLAAPIELNGVFAPADPVEVKIRLDSFNQDLEVTQVAGHGATVAAGEVLLAVDATDIERALKEAQNRKALADINLSKAEIDTNLGEQSDALATRIARRQLENAEQALSWFESVDGEAMLQNAEMMVERAQDSIEDQQDEIDQLQRMYKSEELTEDTADIVVKRALRRLRQSRDQLELTKKRAEKVREKDYVDARQNLVDNLERQKLASAQLENEQAQRTVQRDSTLLSTRAAADAAAEAVADLEADLQSLSLTAPADGVVFYGQINGGTWSGASDDAVEVGEKIKPGQTVATFFQPGLMQITVDLPEGERFRVENGATATVRPTALKDVEVQGTVARISPLVTQKGSNRVFEVTIELPAEMDQRIAPGFSAKVEIEAAGAEHPAVPEQYVRDGQVRVERDGTIETVAVETGQSRNGMIQVTSGLEAGDVVLPAMDEAQPGDEAAQPAAGTEPAADENK